jgi:hypothetical protein
MPIVGKSRAMKAVVAAIVIATSLSAGNGALAAGSAPLALPPPSGTPTASTILDALLAIQRAAATNPTAARNATFSYNAAVQQYNAREFGRARASAVQAIGEAGAPPALAAPLPPEGPAIPRSAFPGPRYDVIPDELPATPANAAKYVGLAHRALATCAAAKTAAKEYAGAVSALSAKHYRHAMAASRNIVDDCAGH